MERVLRPFDVIVSPYVSLTGDVKENPDGNKQKALFMVLAVDYDNITCAKITSQDNGPYLAHSFALAKATHWFLRTDSYVQLDKLHTLSTSSVEFLGYIHPSCRVSIYNILNVYLTSLAENVKRFCKIKTYVSPNVK